MSIKEFYTRFINPKNLFLMAAASIIVLNTWNSYKEIQSMYEKRRKAPFIFFGHRFLGLENIFKNIRYVGYYTDRSLDDPVAAAMFAQAQYVLTPTILDFNNVNHPYTLFDCSSEEIALKKIKEINAIPVKKKLGLILAKKLFSQSKAQ